MRNLVLVKARLARGGMLAIGQSASEPEPHRVRSESLAIGADDLDARGRSPMCRQRGRPSLGGEAGGRSPGFISLTKAIWRRPADAPAIDGALFEPLAD